MVAVSGLAPLNLPESEASLSLRPSARIADNQVSAVMFRRTGTQYTELAPQVVQNQRLKPTSWDRPQTAPRLTPDPHRAAKGYPEMPSALRAPTQVTPLPRVSLPDKMWP